MCYSADKVAKYLIHRSGELGYHINNLQLQKMLYYTQGCFLAALGHPAFEEDIYAWPYGPVIPPVYFGYSYFLSEPICVNIGDGDIDGFSKEEKEIFDYVINRKGGVDAWQLVKDTHSEMPFQNTQEGAVISNGLISDYFKEYFNQKNVKGNMSYG